MDSGKALGTAVATGNEAAGKPIPQRGRRGSYRPFPTLVVGPARYAAIRQLAKQYVAYGRTGCRLYRNGVVVPSLESAGLVYVCPEPYKGSKAAKRASRRRG